MKNNRVFVRDLLEEVYRLLGSNLPRESYAFKGGYILMKEFGAEVRKTMDIDLSISGIDVYYDIIRIISPLLEDYKLKEELSKYKVKEPIENNLKNISGGIKIYRLGNFNGVQRSFKVTDIDISIHSVKKGITVNADGFSQYTFERMLADKICVMYSNTDTILRRIRDVYDIFCIYRRIYRSVDRGLVLDLLIDRGVNISQKSVFENVIEHDPERILKALKDMLEDDTRVDKAYGKKVDIGGVIETVLVCINYFRSYA